MRITVVTVCYNSARTIRDTLASVVAQDWPDIEHVVVDGASTDATRDIVAEYGRDALRLFSEPDDGIYDAMNKGIERSTGDYLVFLNSDDFFARPDAIRLLATRAKETDADFVFGDTRFVATPGNPLSRRLYSARAFRPWWLRLGIMPPHPSMAARRDMLVALGGFDTGIRISGDFDLVARAILKHRRSWTTLPIVTTMFRTGGASTQGPASNLAVGREMARSLARLGQPFASIAVQLRYVVKLQQLLFAGRADASESE